MMLQPLRELRKTVPFWYSPGQKKKKKSYGIGICTVRDRKRWSGSGVDFSTDGWTWLFY